MIKNILAISIFYFSMTAYTYPMLSDCDGSTSVIVDTDEKTTIQCDTCGSELTSFKQD